METVEVNEEYTLSVSLKRDEQDTKKCFMISFRKQKPNLISMRLESGKLFSDSFRLFTEKRWEKLRQI